MPRRPERILVIDDDPDTLELAAGQVLGPLGYSVATATDAASGLAQAGSFRPDAVIVRLGLAGLSGKDLIAALRSQGYQAPIIVTAPKGSEAQVIAAFRLGANDYLTSPLREAELVAAVDRAMSEVRLRREREQLGQRLQQANAQLEQQVRQLTTLYGLGKAVTSITDLEQLLTRVVEGAVYITGAELGWLLLADESSGQLALRAAKGLPPGVTARMHQAWDDGLASLVMRSGEALNISGAGIENLKAGQLVKSALVAPIKVKDQVIGAITVGNKQAGKGFSQRDQAMLSAVADYASISIVNARLFQALEARALSLEQAYEEVRLGETLKDELVQNVSHELRTPLIHAAGYVDVLRRGEAGPLTARQQEALKDLAKKLDSVVRLVEDMAVFSDADTRPETPETVDMVRLAQEALARFEAAARQANVALATEAPPAALNVVVDRTHIARVLDALLENALKFSPQGGRVTLRVRDAGDGLVETMVADTGIGIEAEQLPRVFNRFYQVDGSIKRKFGGAGLGLAVVKKIVEAHGGRVWAESQPGQGSQFYFTLLKSD